MASLLDRINGDLKKAMLAKDSGKTSALRMLKSAVINFGIGKGTDPTDADVRSVIQKQIKQRLDSSAEYGKAGRMDLVKTEKAEITVLEAYLPPQLDDGAIESKLRAMLAAQRIADKKDFGKAMRLAQEDLAGQADNRRISAVLNRLLP